ncbi:hypothetical protein [Altererythrobacter sp. ZODW24]|uniref:polysaccharide deacetylase family protein n=1 Tax=Altererythrobacter sp. ZODW24 TaxID=2185142 RepID=UPI000DF75155|nr:hypothetical protein [Altererythrobacter sp. ZODW24]
MLNLYITVDTEYSAGLFDGPSDSSWADNYARSIRCDTPDGHAGIHYQMERLDAYGLKAVFFVDPLPALIWGPRAAAEIVEPILKAGHDVQLHMHSEWLEFAPGAPLGGKTGRNMSDFNLDEQVWLIGKGIDLLVASGAPRPVAFRAGNYGANDDTLRALAACGMKYDTSFCPGIAESDCAITLPAHQFEPIEHCGTIEVPVDAIGAAEGSARHAQLTALSARELSAALSHALEQGKPNFTLVSHSFELLSRDRQRINKVVKSRFEQLCQLVALHPRMRTATYNDRPPTVNAWRGEPELLPHNPFRTAERMAEQVISNVIYR